MQSAQVVIAHNVRSTHNVGSFFRTCDAAGVQKLYLTGYTPAPIDRFGRPEAGMEKTALGATRVLPWERYEDVLALIDDLRKQGFTIVALEQADTALDYRTYTPPGHMALIIGNEPEGIPPEVLGRCDAVIELPMHGSKESLNVSVALGVALYHFLPPPSSPA